MGAFWRRYCQMLYFVIQALEGCSITITKYPGKSSLCAMIHGFDAQEFLFSDWIKFIVMW